MKTDNNLGVWDIQKPDELYGIGDLHGDFYVLEHILIDLAKVAERGRAKNTTCKNTRLEWKRDRKRVWLVFCGDLVDFKRTNGLKLKEDCDFEILETLFRLQKEAEENESKIIILLGNHEILNFQGNFTYVPDTAVNQKRKSQFTRGSSFARKLAKHTYLSVRINNIIFVHGGFCSEFLETMKKSSGFNGLIKPNQEIIPQLNKLASKYLTDTLNSTELNNVETQILGGTTIDLGNTSGPLWCRDHSLKNKCGLTKISSLLQIPEHDPDSIIYVVAHTPQFSNGINSICNNRVWRIDVGMSRAFEEYPGTIAQLKPEDILDKENSRAMSIIKVSNRTPQNTYNEHEDFEKVTEGVLSKDFVKNKFAILNENTSLVKQFVDHFYNNKKKLKSIFPIMKEISKQYKELRKVIDTNF